MVTRGPSLKSIGYISKGGPSLKSINIRNKILLTFLSLYLIVKRGGPSLGTTSTGHTVLRILMSEMIYGSRRRSYI